MLRALGYQDIERFNINEGHAALLTVRLLTDEAKKGGRKSNKPGWLVDRWIEGCIEGITGWATEASTFAANKWWKWAS
jgi:hypothetical protein